MPNTDHRCPRCVELHNEILTLRAEREQLSRALTIAIEECERVLQRPSILEHTMLSLRAHVSEHAHSSLPPPNPPAAVRDSSASDT